MVYIYICNILISIHIKLIIISIKFIYFYVYGCIKIKHEAHSHVKCRDINLKSIMGCIGLSCFDWDMADHCVLLFNERKLFHGFSRKS